MNKNLSPFKEGRKLGAQRLDALIELYSKDYSPSELGKIEKRSKTAVSQVISIVRSTRGYNKLQDAIFYLGYFSGRYIPF